MNVKSAEQLGDRTLKKRQVGTAAALLVGYSGYYLCRSNLAVASPLLLTDPTIGGLDRNAIGFISSVGVITYASGKLITGIAGDFVGGRKMFLVGLFGSVLATVLFGFGSSVGWLAIVWAINRLFQSAGWGGLVKIASHWFSTRQYGAAMAVLSLSFLFGDAVGRYVLGGLIAGGLGWRALFLASASTLAVIGVWLVTNLRSSPREVGLDEPEVSPANVFGASGGDARPQTLRSLLAPYLSSGSFWLVCLISFGLTLIRETFNIWTPIYLVDAQRLSVAQAAAYSSVFPLVGGLSTLAVGWWSDRIGDRRRMILVVPCLILCVLSLAALALLGSSGRPLLAVTAIGSIAMWLLGPYSLLAGAMALDLGGRKGSATAAGLIDTAGYAGAVFSGFAVGRIVEWAGWATVFQTLAAVAASTVVAAVALMIHQHAVRVARVDWERQTV